MEVMEVQHGEEVGYFNCHLMVTAIMHTAATNNNDTDTGLLFEDAIVQFVPILATTQAHS